MIENRDYMRESQYGPRWQWTVTYTLLAINLAVFVAQWIVEATTRTRVIDIYAGLSFEGLFHGYIWQLVSYQFLHAGILHLVLNSIGIYAFGPLIERLLGVRRFLQLYIVSGVIGGAFHVLVSYLVFRIMGSQAATIALAIPVVGASASLYGLIAAFATLFPRQELTVFLFFVFPITVTARVLAGVSAGIAVLGMFFATDSVAHGAHLGGMLGGWMFIQFLRKPGREAEPESGTSRFQSEMVNVFSRKADADNAVPRKAKEEPTVQEFVSSEVDPILDKISAHGIQSLTDREKKILEAARKKMEKR